MDGTMQRSARLPAGDYLRNCRSKLRMTSREVEAASRRIADEERNEELFISHGRITQIETGESTPSIYKLYTLGIIYSVPLIDLLAQYVDLARISKHQMSVNVQATRPASIAADSNRSVSFPIRFDSRHQIDKTNLLAQMVEVWGDIPISLIQDLNVRRMHYGFIGLGDYTMYPLLRPGSFVQFDERQKKIARGAWQTEFDRPIYFIELRDAYVCSWCEIRADRLISIPHPLSPCSTREFAFPREAEVLGRVTAVAARLVTYTSPEPSARAQAAGVAH